MEPTTPMNAPNYPHQLSGTPTAAQINDVAIWLYELILFQRNTFEQMPTMNDLINLTNFDRSFLRGLLTVLTTWNWIAYDLSQFHCPMVITRVSDVRHDPAAVARVFAKHEVTEDAEPAQPSRRQRQKSTKRMIRESIHKFGSTW